MLETKITDVKTFSVKGPLTHEGDAPFWEERLVRPIDIYPEYKSVGPQEVKQISPNQV